MVNDGQWDGLIVEISIDTTKNDGVVAVLVHVRHDYFFLLAQKKQPNTFLQSFQGENDYYYHRRRDCATYESRYKSTQWHSVCLKCH